MEKSNFEFEGFTSSNKKYIFKGKISQENLIITTSDEYNNDVIKNNYILDINFNELKKIKIFSLYETLEEAVNGLISIIENNLESKKNNIVDEDSNKITLTIPVFFGKFKEIKFEFTLKSKTMEDKIDSLISTINILKKENESLKLFKEQNEKYLNIISFFFSYIWNSKIFQDFYTFAEEVMKSNIVKTFLSNIVNEIVNLNKKKDIDKNDKKLQEFKDFISKLNSFKIKLLYRATEKGDTISQIYECFNEINNKPKEFEGIVTLIKVNNKVIYFFTEYIWKITNKFQPIKFTIIALKNIFENAPNKFQRENEKGILFSKEKIKIGENFIEINDNFLKNKSCSIKKSNENNWPKINEIFDLKDEDPENYSFKIDEMEMVYVCLEKE